MTYTPLDLYRKDLAALMVKTRLLLHDPSGERWTDTRVIEAINFAALEFAIITECIKDEVEVQLLANQWSYDIKQAVEASATLNPYGWPVRIGYYGKESGALKPTTSHVVDLSGATVMPAGSSNQFQVNMLSYGEVGVIPIPSTDGEALPGDEGNIQVTYIGMPESMDAVEDFPDEEMQEVYHQYIPYEAASLLLEEGDEEDLIVAADYDANFKSGCYEAIGDQYQGQTGYADMRPM